MLAPISMDLRLRIVGAVEHRSSIREEKAAALDWWADLASFPDQLAYLIGFAVSRSRDLCVAF
jgi:hypothetical protein